MKTKANQLILKMTPKDLIQQQDQQLIQNLLQIFLIYQLIANTPLTHYTYFLI